MIRVRERVRRVKRNARIPALLLAALLPVSCSDRTLSLFFDIPPPSAEETTAAQPATTPAEVAAVEPMARPPIESVATWKEARKLFPMDQEGRKGRPDWTAAVRQGIIAPRGSVDGAAPPASTFNYDFFYPPTEPGFEVYFPHSTHNQWIVCESCHPRIFPVRGGVELTKKKLKKGEYCGVCHRRKNGTAFWLKSCDRCHPNAEEDS